MTKLLSALIIGLLFTQVIHAEELLQDKVRRGYAFGAHHLYRQSLIQTLQMQKEIELFLDNPNPATLNAAKVSWTQARKIYGLTEVFRFYQGPIDNAQTGVEGYINAWPLDESYIDYVVGQENAGIINNQKDYPIITKEVLLSLNGRDGEANVATGYHAIEFLLWGQDLSITGPGERSYTDFAQNAFTKNTARRRTYLKLVTELLIEHLQQVTNAWDLQEGSYRQTWNSEASVESLKKIFTGMVYLSGDELKNERLNVPYETQSQEDEHSCFSDTTVNDLIANQKAIINVFLGQYLILEVYSPYQLLEQKNSELADSLKTKMNETLHLIENLPRPFDQAILAPKNSPERLQLKKVIDQLDEQTKMLLKAALELGIEVEF
jgi:putative iron-regulated protein